MCHLKKNRLNRPQTSRGGFTLAELLVASTLLSLTMVGMYTAFYSSLRTWRGGEASLETYQAVRTAVGVMTRELQCIAGGSLHLFEGEEDEIEFYCVAPPMEVDKGRSPRVMRVRYRLKPVRGRQSVLVREEADVESAFPPPPPAGEKVHMGRLRVSHRKREFELITEVKDLEIRYFWAEHPARRDRRRPPPPPRIVIEDENRRGWGLPQGVEISLTVVDANAPRGETTFTTMVAFRGPTTAIHENRVGGPQGIA